LKILEVAQSYIKASSSSGSKAKPLGKWLEILKPHMDYTVNIYGIFKEKIWTL
jgi:hypothetical protein